MISLIVLIVFIHPRPGKETYPLAGGRSHAFQHHTREFLGAIQDGSNYAAAVDTAAALILEYSAALASDGHGGDQFQTSLDRVFSFTLDVTSRRGRVSSTRLAVASKSVVTVLQVCARTYTTSSI